MAWTRDIGVVTTEEVGAQVAQATADVCGRLSDVDAARREDLVKRLTGGADVSRAELDELQRLNVKATVKMSPEDIATIDAATKLAEEGVRLMGGRAHVFLGGSDRVETQPEAPIKGVRQTSITVTVSVTSGAGVEQPEASPAKVTASAVPWEG